MSTLHVYAATPTLTLSNTGSSDSVLLTATGDAQSNVTLSYYSTLTSGLQTTKIGTTDTNGKFWSVISTQGYGISSSASVFVTVNGQQSVGVAWPYTNTGTSGNTFTLSQTGVVLGIGQSTTITASNATQLYLFNNTNPSILNVSISGNQINLSANGNGSTVVTLCSGSASNCIGVYVTVQNGNASLLTFSQSNVTIAAGQSATLSIYGGSGVYSVSSNSSATTVQTSLSGSNLTVSANSGEGHSSITVCTTDQLSCGVVNVTIGTANSSAITPSQLSPSLQIGQTLALTLAGSSGSFTISSNSNSSAVQATVSGTSLNLYGIAYGSATIIACSSTGSCASIVASVSSAGGGGSITLSQTSLALAAGQTVSVSISGGTTPYSVTTTSSNIVQTTLSTNILTVTGVSAGQTTVNVCSALGGCVALQTTVNGTNATTYGNAPGFSQSQVQLAVGQTGVVSIVGSGGYYVASNTYQNVVSTTINNGSISLLGLYAGSSTITVCESTARCNILTVTVSSSLNQTSLTGSPVLNPVLTIGEKTRYLLSGNSANYYLSSANTASLSAALSGNDLTLLAKALGTSQVSVCVTGASCLTFTVTVLQSSSQSAGASAATPVTSTTASKYLFTLPLSKGDVSTEVVELQKRLHKEGFFGTAYSTHFGDATVIALQKYQKAHGLKQLGNLGPATRTLLNK